MLGFGMRSMVLGKEIASHGAGVLKCNDKVKASVLCIGADGQAGHK
jgi:hypothetical protein